MHTWALRALTANVRLSQMKTRGLLYPLRCMKMWRQTVESRPHCMTLKMAGQGQYFSADNTDGTKLCHSEFMLDFLKKLVFISFFILRL